MKEKMLGSIWFWWGLTTIMYVTIDYYLDPTIYLKQPLELSLDMFGRVIGLFVPFGLRSLFMFVTPFGWLGLAVFIATMVYGNKYISASNVSLCKKIAFIWVALFLITFAVDFARGTPLGSFDILFNGFHGYGL